MKRFFYKRISLALLFTLLSGMVWAQIPNGYYNSAEGKTGQELRQALHNIIYNHTKLNYNKLKDYYKDTDVDKNGYIIDIYTNEKRTLSQSGWNKEHSWPQSWFNEQATPKSDLFHVYPVDATANNMRSNFPYAVVNEKVTPPDKLYTTSNGSKRGRTTMIPGYTGFVFEPADQYKGDLARTYFYMSTCYYGVDSGWDETEMTNKSDLKPWAVEMLLQWNDEDPVSQKEIDRNNAVYKHQKNRNPFIDNPDYAHMIWDENWTAGTYYDITCATGLQNGTVTAPARAAEGSTVTITATPDVGYLTQTLSAYKTGDPATTVSVTTNGTFVMPDYAVTVSATFKKDDTNYRIDLADVTHGTINASAPTALCGTTVTLTATPDEGYTLHSWYVCQTGNENVKVTVNDNQFAMPAYNVTVAATFARDAGAVGNGDFAKVTVAPTDWSGTYLIVCETENVAFDGSLEKLDAVNNTKAVTIEDGIITSTDELNAAVFTIEAVAGGYAILSASGNYIGQASDANGLIQAEGPMLNTITMDGSDVNIVSTGGAYLRFNNTSNQMRFRYYKSSTYTNQQAIQLYKKSEKAEDVFFTITFHNGDDSYTQTVKENEPTALEACTFTNNGYVFDGWTTKENGEGEYYEDGANITLLADLDLYAQWDMLYSVTIQQEGDGTVDVTPTEAVEGTIITVKATPAEGFNLQSITVSDNSGNAFELEGDEFEMPASNITVSVVFASPSTGILSIDANDIAKGNWHAIDGRAVNGKPQTKGIYIRNGKKLIIK